MWGNYMKSLIRFAAYCVLGASFLNVPTFAQAGGGVTTSCAAASSITLNNSLFGVDITVEAGDTITVRSINGAFFNYPVFEIIA